MKALTIAAAALAVFFLVMSMVISAPAAAPAAATGLDRCLMCHPTAHPDGWTQSMHVTELRDGTVSAAECTRCHDTQYCATCHAQYRAAQQNGGAAPSTTP